MSENKKRIKKRYVLLFFVLVLLVGLLLPEEQIIPVYGAASNDWNHNTFWYEPWGKSGVHKGIDIFAKQGQAVISSTYGLVIFNGTLGIGGNVVIVLGPKWRLHYYAHMQTGSVTTQRWLSKGEVLGAVGDTGNAQGKAPHLHYSIVTLIPYPWRWDSLTQGWKKIFFLNPSKILLAI